MTRRLTVGLAQIAPVLLDRAATLDKVVARIREASRASDIPPGVPHRDAMRLAPDEVLYDGGSAIAGPDGSWVVPPVVGVERLIVAELDHDRVLEERQNFDPVGHYARPDVLRLHVDRRRQSTIADTM